MEPSLKESINNKLQTQRAKDVYVPVRLSSDIYERLMLQVETFKTDKSKFIRSLIMDGLNKLESDE